METLKYIIAGVAAGIITTFFVVDAVDTEMARKDYNENVDQCKQISGCVFGWNCNHYNKMIEEACND